MTYDFFLRFGARFLDLAFAFSTSRSSSRFVTWTSLRSRSSVSATPSGLRTITRMLGREVWVDGDGLDPIGDGYPNWMEIVDRR